MTMPCHISDALARTLPWETEEYPCRDCGERFPPWRDTPYDPEITDQCPDCHAVERLNEHPEELE